MHTYSKEQALLIPSDNQATKKYLNQYTNFHQSRRFQKITSTFDFLATKSILNPMMRGYQNFTFSIFTAQSIFTLTKHTFIIVLSI